MTKRISAVIVLLMFSTAVFASVAISGKHKDKMQDGKKINCSYCHAGEMKIEKKKGQNKDKKLNGVLFSKIKGCAGKECHK